MLDINLIRENPDVVRNALKLRQMDTDVVSRILEIDQQRRSLLTKAEALKNERNTVSKEISQVKDPEQRKAKIEAMRVVGDQIAELDEQIRKVEAEQTEILSGIPNLPAEDTPLGKDDSENIVCARYR
jgi:seryl-tRNA synthetase